MPEPLYAELKGWNTAAILDAAMTVMIADHGYEAVLEVIRRKMLDEAHDAAVDGAIGYGKSLQRVARHVEAAVGTLAFTSKRKPA